MSYASIDELRSHLGDSPKVDAAYSAKMLHPVPESCTVDRTVFVLQRVAGKRVLEFGASGHLHEGIVKAAVEAHGVDRESTADGLVQGFDLDDPLQVGLPFAATKPDIIVCGEVLEHLGNPGWFLHRLREQYEGVPVIITVPNALSSVSLKHIGRGIENVNKDHVAYYSFTTLKTLLARYGYTIKESFWYNGPPYVAEGLIVVAE